MSTQQPARPSATRSDMGEASQDESSNIAFLTVAGTLALVVFLGGLCAALLFGGLFVSGVPLTDILLTPGAK